MSTVEGNGWSQYEKLVMSDLRTHGKRLENIERCVHKIDKRLIVIETKAAIWGGLTGLVAGVVLHLIF